MEETNGNSTIGEKYILRIIGLFDSIIVMEENLGEMYQ